MLEYMSKPTETAIRSLQHAPPLKSIIPLGEFQTKSITCNLRKNALCELPQRSDTMNEIWDELSEI